MTEMGKIVQSKTGNGEIDFHGRAVSRGVAVGTALCLHGRGKQFFRVEVKNNQIVDELNRLSRAVSIAERQLENLTARRGDSDGAARAEIFSAHLLILSDASFKSNIENLVKHEKINVEWAIKQVSERIIDDYMRIGDEHLRERYIDLRDVSDRLLNALDGEKRTVLPAENSVVVVAREIKPSTLIELSEINLRAIVTETGGWTSHTFILAREMNLPAVTGIGGILRRTETGDNIVVDGYEGKVILNPTDRISRAYRFAAEENRGDENEIFEPSADALKTLDGRLITVRANVDLPSAYRQAHKFGARGVGLYRSEFLFNLKNRLPDEAEQITAYRKIADATGTETVRIRTFDLSREQFGNEPTEREANPALGLRAIRYGLAHSKQFRIQASALLQASANNRNIDIVLPMISDVSEIAAAKQIINEEKARLSELNIETGNPLLGVMIEVPSAVFMCEEIASRVDFLSLGTNDLVQYLLAADRDNPAVADWFRTLHPAVIRAVKHVLAAAEKTETPVLFCGEMAGSPFYAPVLIGLGATDFSMNVTSLARVRRVVAGIAFEEARELARRLERCATADEAEALVKNYFVEKWSHLYSPDILPSAKK